jgi:acetyl-CoA acetyltransferase
MSDIAVVAFAQLPSLRHDPDREEAELVQPVVQSVFEQTGLCTQDMGFICSGSSDYLVGRPFSFVAALDGIGPWPPVSESHVEMDGAWALYEAWVRLHHGDIETALVYGFGKSSLGDIREIAVQQLDPYYLAPLGLDSISIAALQARMLLDEKICTETDLARIAQDNRRKAKTNPYAQIKGDFKIEDILEEQPIVSPLRKHDCAPISDGAAAIILATKEKALELCDNPAWIKGMDHRIEPHSPGCRNMAESRSTRLAGESAGVGQSDIDFAELHAPFTHQEVILRRALSLDDSVNINPSGGALAANPIMATGLIRFGEAAQRLSNKEGKRAIAHATSGPCLQHNLVAVLEVDA